MAWLRAPVVLFLLGLFAIGAVTASALVMRSVVRESDQALERSAFDLGDAERLRSLRERVSRKTRTFLLTGEARYLRDLREADAAWRAQLTTRRAAAQTPAERSLLDRLQASEDARRQVTERLVERREKGAVDEALIHSFDSDLQPIADVLDATLAGLVDHHQHKVAAARAEAAGKSTRAVHMIWIAAALAVLVAAVSSAALARTLRRIEGRAERTRRHLAAIVESSEDAVYSKDLDGRILSWNRSAERVFGYVPDEIIGHHVSELAPPELADDIAKILDQIRAGRAVPHLETLRRAKDGRLIDVVLAVSPIHGEAGQVVGAAIIARDVTEERRLRRERDRFFELSLDMVCIAGTDGFFRQLNPTFEAVLGHSRAELLERSFFEFVHPDDFKATVNVLEELANGKPTVDFENRYRCSDGSYKWLSWHATPEEDGTVYALARDVTERKANQERLAAMAEDLRAMALVDDLTGLHNRRGFNILVEQELKRVRRSRQKATFIFADVDGLKQINDKLGHEVGDRAICDAAVALRSAFRKSDIVARLGGDEFVVMCTDGAIEPAAPLARLDEAIRQYNSSIPARPFTLAISVGSTVHDPEQPESVDAILKRADQLMYEHKARRKAAARMSAH
jgi:diguanylate cyclase (GGDEF)-like protein/PAS domain S-box-containing protein